MCLLLFVLQIEGATTCCNVDVLACIEVKICLLLFMLQIEGAATYCTFVQPMRCFNMHRGQIVFALKVCAIEGA